VGLVEEFGIGPAVRQRDLIRSTAADIRFVKMVRRYGDAAVPAVRTFVGGLMLLAGLIPLAAYANLGSLFAARAANRSRQAALRLALGSSRSRILRGLLTEAVSISHAGSGLFRRARCSGPIRMRPSRRDRASRVLAFIVYQATPRDPLVLAGVVLAKLSLGLLATWIPAQRALSADPSALLREQ